MEHTVEIASGAVRVRSRKVRLRTLDHLDGRTKAAQRAKALARTFTAALGDDLSAMQIEAVRAAAIAVAIAEDAQARRLAGEPIPLDEVLRSGRYARLMVKALGIEDRGPDWEGLAKRHGAVLAALNAS
jgi:hypothetical protein